MTTAGNTRHHGLTAVLSALDDAELAALVDAGRVVGVGVGGGSAVLDVDGVPVFAKRIPLTDRELAHPRSTANLFDLPMSCQYGIGGPSLNAWRELAANLLVTDAVPADGTRSFPVLHHWRVLPGRAPVAAEHVDVDAVVATWGGSPAVRARLEALTAAPSSLVLFSEYVPHPLEDWLRDDPVGKAAAVERGFAWIVASLRERDLLHMDGHLGNMRTDGERIHLCDFGLATSPRFDLSATERDFVRRNAAYDADHAAMRLVNWLVTDVCGVPVPTGGAPVARNECVRRCAAGDLPDGVPPVVAGILARHAPAAARMNAFHWRLFDGEVDAEYPGPGR
ncbi:serine/threonine protein phosphatase [Saccharothrix australiensis]|uniref:Serine/threonine protein phosphatase n=1 Tax=Saccharothrix australiensis TaxID=2072 RepID=A0A495W0K7_9PSEU|nr:serine/threonine protein phosphatase [Saccharothrix australiensis]RKT54547.1 hypothetical protein C8E97_3191 [Saccharothrix australiensis]